MRRALLVPLLSLGLLAGPAYAQTGASSDDPVGPDHARLPAAAADRATEALQAAKDAMAGKGGDVTMALVDLRLAYDGLSARQKREADAILARPTDGSKDPGAPDGKGYTTTSVSVQCSASTPVCVHWVNASGNADYATASQASATLAEMNRVWTYELGASSPNLGYRAPMGDGSRGGGTNKFDVYLKDLTPQGFYGYCNPESDPNPSDYVFRATGYCVLDNDFVGYGASTPAAALAVTAAHEFFHAIQFNYDYDEDHWIMEATATWMEERYADAIDDNRQYLAEGQLRRNAVPLDAYEVDGYAQYGNWVFFELLSQTYGVGVVKSVWQLMDSSNPDTDRFSTQALAAYLSSKSTTLPRFYARYAGSALIPKKVWSEGAAGAYPSPPIYASYTLSSAAPKTGLKSTSLNHLTNRDYAFVPSSGLTGPWKLKVTVDGPDLSVGTGAYVIVHNKDGSVVTTNVNLSTAGAATLTVPFSATNVARVTLTLANGGWKMSNCWSAPANLSVYYACYGTPRYNNQAFSFSGTLTQ